MLPMVYDSLRYLATRDDVDSRRVGLAGFSTGGALSLHSAAAWAQAAYAESPDLKFAAHAPFYPVCWAFSAFAQGKRTTPNVPTDAFAKWTGVPVKIFAGGMDDYDDKDPNACTEFISRIPAEYQKSFSVQLYPEATHGWDQQSATFYAKFACKGRGCTNHNESNPKLAQQSVSDLVVFFRKTLYVPQ
jgi:dienelactone hydrolase